MNDIAENGAIRVRFVHMGVSIEGDVVAARPMCAPKKSKYQLTKDVAKVTCPHCKLAIEDFLKWMANPAPAVEVDGE